jgi:thiamine biosynthesis lipoprotein
MGCRATIIVEAHAADGERLAELSMLRVAKLEACWSRFLPDSDVSRLNRAGGAAIGVRPDTVTLLQAMAEATRATGGAYDPTVGTRDAHRGEPSSWIDRVAIDVAAGVVRIDAGLQLDPGGIGKGLAADLVVAAAVADGAADAVVSLGGDLRTSGPARRRHLVDIAAPSGDGPIDRIVVGDGAVATSGTRRSGLVDPATGREVASGLVQASVVAATGAAAEAFTTSVLVGGMQVFGRLDEAGIGILAVRDDGVLIGNESWRQRRHEAMAVA